MFLNLILVFFLLLFCIYLFFSFSFTNIYFYDSCNLVIFSESWYEPACGGVKEQKVFLFITSDLFSPLRVAGSFINAFYGGTNAWIMPAAALQKKKKKMENEYVRKIRHSAATSEEK